MSEPHRPAAGRPRDPEKDSAVLAAARELLSEGGYASATIVAIARRAGVGTPTIYRRWAGREMLIEDAVFGSREIYPPIATGDLEHDLHAWVTVFLGHLADPATRAAIPGLLAAYQQDEQLYGLLLARIERGVRTDFTDTVTPALDSTPTSLRSARADALFDMLVGATMVRALTVGMRDAETFTAQTADALTALARSTWTR